MNFHYLFKEIGLFLIVVCFFVCPSLFNNARPEEVFRTWNFPFFLMISCAGGFLTVYIKDRDLLSIKKSDSTLKAVVNGGTFLSTFGILCLSEAVFQLLAYFILKETDSQQITSPAGFRQFVFCFLTFLFSASLEEFIFRLYLPKAFFDIFKVEKYQKRVAFLIGEFAPALLFALCHRYLGWFAVLNAFICHFALRRCYIKTQNVLYGIAAHFIYNILNLFVICYLN